MNRLNPDEEMENFPLANEIDNAILMHRDVHFGGNFEFMIDYYMKEGKGSSPEFTIKRIQELDSMEKRTGQNLAAVLLSGAEAEKVARAKMIYKELRELYEKTSGKTKYPLLIADLILSEDEGAEKEIAAIVAEKGAVVPSLIELLHSEDMYDPLFPGYGQAPALASKCLGLIGDKRAIISLFESIGESDLFNEEIVLDALKGIGEPAKVFLLKVLNKRPLNIDNERAAIALIPFKSDPEVSATCLKMLQDPDVRKDPSLATYLALACEGLSDPEQRKIFTAMAEDPLIAKELRNDIKAVSNSWK